MLRRPRNWGGCWRTSPTTSCLWMRSSVTETIAQKTKAPWKQWNDCTSCVSHVESRYVFRWEIEPGCSSNVAGAISKARRRRLVALYLSWWNQAMICNILQLLMRVMPRDAPFLWQTIRPLLRPFTRFSLRLGEKLVPSSVFIRLPQCIWNGCCCKRVNILRGYRVSHLWFPESFLAPSAKWWLSTH